MHFSKQRHEHRRFAGACGSDNEVENTLLEDDVAVEMQTECLTGGRQRPVGHVVGPRKRGFAQANVGLVAGGGVHNGGIILCLGELVKQLRLANLLAYG